MIYLSEKKIAVIGIDHGYGNIKTANSITPTANYYIISSYRRTVIN